MAAKLRGAAVAKYKITYVHTTGADRDREVDAEGYTRDEDYFTFWGRNVPLTNGEPRYSDPVLTVRCGGLGSIEKLE
jgi:hypothetical protein